MPRQNRRHTEEKPGAPTPMGSSAERLEDYRGETYVVRSVFGAAATKAYRCPGCDQEVRVGVAHIVAWPEFDDGAADRRHWHTACWTARDRRTPGVQRSRNAPRY